MMRTVSIRLEVSAAQADVLDCLRTAYADASNRLVPVVREHRVWNRVALHRRAYTMLRDTTMLGSQVCCGEHQRCILAFGKPKEAELIYRKGQWFFNLVVESDDVEPVAFGPVMGVDVGENNLAAVSTGKVFGGEHLRDQRDRYLALRRRLQSNGSQSAKQKLRQVSGKEMRRVKHINHESSKAIVAEASRIGI